MIKKILKSKIFLVIVTMIFSVGTTVFAAIVYNANQISYTPSDENWSANRVDLALNDLYTKNKTNTTEYLNFKSGIATAITNRGIETSSTDTVETMSANIASIAFNPSIELMEYRISNIKWNLYRDDK